MGNALFNSFSRFGVSTDWHARIIHNTVMSHPAISLVKVNALFEALYTQHLANGDLIPVARCNAANEILGILDMFAERLHMPIPPREELPNTHESFKGAHPANLRRHK